MRRHVLVPILLALLVPSCVTKQADLTAERAAIHARDREWLAAATAGDVDRTVSFWTDDAAVYAPNAAPVVGTAALRQMVVETSKFPGFRVTWQTDSVIVSASGDVAYGTGTNAFTVNDSTGQPVTTSGRVLVVWRKGSDGVWRCAVELWNNGPAADGRTP